MNYELRNIERIDADSFDCEVNESNLGWVPFSACKEDSTAMGREIFAQIESDGITHATYVKPSITRQEVESIRKAAYANPQSGSDRLFAEAQRMQLMSEAGWEAVRDTAVARFNEIQTENPWPDLETN